MIKKVSLNDFTDKLAGTEKFKNKFEGDNSETRKKMAKLIQKIADGELTQRQKECLFMYYEKEMKMSEVGDTLGICISCVSRHIKKAKAKIRRTVAYYYSLK